VLVGRFKMVGYHSGDLSEEARGEVELMRIEWAKSEAVTQESLGRSPWALTYGGSLATRAS
jgi:hypothetical protein